MDRHTHKTEPDYQEKTKEIDKQRSRRAWKEHNKGTKVNQSVKGEGYARDSSGISVMSTQQKQKICSKQGLLTEMYIFKIYYLSICTPDTF